MRILITGSKGFIGKNLLFKLKTNKSFICEEFSRDNSIRKLEELINRSDVVIHLAGENRPKEELDFEKNNLELTKLICNFVRLSNRKIPILFASSIQAELDNPYGKSKLSAELELYSLEKETGNPVFIFRLPGVFGKWSKPNYNSVVATFCHNIANNLPVEISNPNKKLRLVFVDDVVNNFIQLINSGFNNHDFLQIQPEYKITLRDLASKIKTFRDGRKSLIIDNVGLGINRALYSTYISFIPKEQFSYSVPSYSDERGTFAEVLKNQDSGQFSFFTCFPGEIRGNHYHHTKTEKFLVLKGKAQFKFRNIITEEEYELITNGEKPIIVDTIPGWAHSIKNIGSEKLFVILWANEIFDKSLPDTYHAIP